MRRRSRQGQAHPQSGRELAELDKAQHTLEAAIDPELAQRFEKSLNLTVPVVPTSSRSSSDSEDTSRTKGIPVRIGKEISADSTFKELEKITHPAIFISLPLPPEVSRVEPLQELCISRIATIMAQWTGHMPADQNPHVGAAQISMLPLGIKERLLRTLTCRLALSNFSLRPLLSTSLRSLDLSMCAALTDAALDDLLTLCPALEKVSFRGLRLSGDSVLRFMREAPALDSIDLNGLRLNAKRLNDVIAARRHPLEVNYLPPQPLPRPAGK